LCWDASFDTARAGNETAPAATHRGRELAERRRMDSSEEREAQLERPVRDAGPKPAGPGGPPFGVYGCAGLAVVLLVCAVLGFGGLFQAWIAAGVIVAAAGIVMVVQMVRRNRRI
jgi:Flp pilus assembly protein TadB